MSEHSGDVTGALYVTLLAMKTHTAIKQHIDSLDRPVVQSLVDILRLVVAILDERLTVLKELDTMKPPIQPSLVDRSRWN
jgi:hypothetical protein